MPTLTYDIDLECANCGEEQEHKLPLGSAFIAYEKIGQFLSGEPVIIESGYHKNYNKDKHKTIKRCTHCRTAMLVREGEV